jgi:hypothetical protein
MVVAEGESPPMEGTNGEVIGNIKARHGSSMSGATTFNTITHTRTGSHHRTMVEGAAVAGGQTTKPLVTTTDTIMVTVESGSVGIETPSGQEAAAQLSVVTTTVLAGDATQTVTVAPTQQTASQVVTVTETDMTTVIWSEPGTSSNTVCISIHCFDSMLMRFQGLPAGSVFTGSANAPQPSGTFTSNTTATTTAGSTTPSTSASAAVSSSTASSALEIASSSTTPNTSASSATPTLVSEQSSQATSTDAATAGTVTSAPVADASPGPLFPINLSTAALSSQLALGNLGGGGETN